MSSDRGGDEGGGLPELENPIIALGNQVVFGVLLPDAAVERITRDAALAAAPDDRIEALITEADGYWRERLDAAVDHPWNVAIYAEIAVALAERRLRRIGAFRKGAAASDRASFDARMAHWIGVTARALVAAGTTRLLFEDEAAVRAAYEAFDRAGWTARALPDEGRLRLREVLWAARGRHIAASLGGQRQLVAMADQELTGLVRAPGREAEAQQHLARIEQALEAVHDVIQERAERAAGGTDGGAAAADDEVPDVAGDEAPPVSPPPADAEPEDYALFYQALLNWFGGLVLAGRLSAEAAAHHLVAEVDLSRLEPRYIYYVAELQRGLVESAPDRARILGELNHAVAGGLTGELAELTRGYCAYTVARARAAEARRARPEEPERYRSALPWLEEALRLLGAGEPDEVSRVHCAAIVALLGLCHRGIGDFAGARDYAREAILRHEELPATPFHRANLGAAYGNLADAEEQLGDVAAARLDYYRAFELFAEARDTDRLRASLADYARLCAELGRLDDAYAAQERAAALMAELADLPGAVGCYLDLAESAFSTRRFAHGMDYLGRADALLEPGPADSPDAAREHLELRFRVRIWEGYVRSLLAIAAGGADDAEHALTTLESARAMAGELGDPDRIGTVLLQQAMLLGRLGRLAEAEARCAELDGLAVSPDHRARRREILADIRRGQGRHAEAVDLLEESVAEYRDEARSDRLAVVLHHLGECQEALGDDRRAAESYEEALAVFERHRLGLYEASRLESSANAAETYERAIALRADPASPAFDAVRALDLLERSKSRVFAEVLGLSRVQPRGAAGALGEELDEEARLLTRVAQLRTALFLAPAPGGGSERIGLQQELAARLERLDALWRRIAQVSPEYDEIRRGTTLDWADYRALLAV